jgi:hypothetical protein
MILTSWADTSFHGLIRGLPAVGYAPAYGIFPQQPAEVISMADVLEGWQEHNQHILGQLKASKDDAFLLQQSMEDSLNGFCTPPLRRAEFLQLIGNKAHRLIPRCVITQSSGRQRVISTTATPGDNQPCHLTPTSLPCAVLCDQRNTSAYDASMVGGGRRRFLLA